MSDFDKSAGDSAALDAILNEIKARREGVDSSAQPAAASKQWSLDDIDRLIADTSVKKAPAAKAPEPPAVVEEPLVFEPEVPPLRDEQQAKILSDEFDSSIFTVQQTAAVSYAEPDDIFSASVPDPLPEVEGQESFFAEPEQPQEDFDIETVVVPDEAPKVSAEQKYIEDRAGAASAQQERPRPVIVSAPQETDSALAFFKQRAVPVPEDEGDDDEPEKASIFEPNEFRARFFNNMQLEKTAELDDIPEGPVEKPGIVVERLASDENRAGDLQPLPKLLAAEDALDKDGMDGKTIIVGTEKKPVLKPVREDDRVDGQIILTGFDEARREEEPVQAAESDIEQELWEKRKQRAKSFKILDSSALEELRELDSSDEAAQEEKSSAKEKRKDNRRHLEDEQPDSSVPAGEYTMSAERVAVHSRLNREMSRATASLVVSIVFEAAFLLLFFLPKVLKALSFETVALAEGSSFLFIANAVLLTVLAVVNNEYFIDGFSKLFSRTPDADSAVSLSIALSLAQCVLCAVCGDEAAGIPVFAAAAALGCVASALARRNDAQRILDNFEICAYKKEHNLYAIHRFDNEAEIFELGRGLLMGNAELLYSSKIGFPTDFLKNSAADSTRTATVKTLLPAAGAGAVIAAVLAGIFTRSGYMAFAALTGTFCMAAPVLASLCSALTARKANFALNAAGSMIVSLDAAEKTTRANAVVIDSADIFDRSRCAMHGMKDFKNIRIDDVLLYAAALVIKSGGPLRESFEQVVGNRQDLLPAVKELVYEDKLGIAARILGQKVLLGNRSLLENHSVEVPEQALEDKYSHSGRKVMYLAVAGKIAALFVVSYAVDMSLLPYLKELESNGTQILVRTNDVNVTEDLLAKSFGMPKTSFKILSSVAGRLYKRRRDAVTDRLSVRIIHDGTAYSMLRTVAAAGRMTAAARLSYAAQIAVSAVGFVAATVLSCIGRTALFNAFTAAAFVALGGIIAGAIVLIKRVK